jgi:hypothetical protein
MQENDIFEEFQFLLGYVICANIFKCVHSQHYKLHLTACFQLQRF